MTDWYELGLNLGISEKDLNFIEADNLRTKVSLRKTFQLVLEQDPSLSWQKVAAALRSRIVGKDSLARKIECKFCT